MNAREDREKLLPLLREEAYEAISHYARAHPRILSTLSRLTYEGDPLVSWRAVTAIGNAAALIAETEPERIRQLLLRWLWLLNDESGSIGWRAPEVVGEILWNCPDRFTPFFGLLSSLLKEMASEDRPRFLPGILWALWRTLPVMPGECRPPTGQIVGLLHHPQPVVRALAALCLAGMGNPDTPDLLGTMIGDESPLILYRDSRLQETTVSTVAAEALERIRAAATPEPIG